MADITGVLQEYVATANNPEYGGDWDVINSKFPELKDFDPNVLEEYVATANNPDYGNNWNIINGKFPEFQQQQKEDLPADEEAKEGPSQEDVTVEGEDGASNGEESSTVTPEQQDAIDVLTEIQNERLTEEEEAESDLMASEILGEVAPPADREDSDKFIEDFFGADVPDSSEEEVVSEEVDVDEEPNQDMFQEGSFFPNEDLLVSTQDQTTDVIKSEVESKEKTRIKTKEGQLKDARKKLELINKSLPEDKRTEISDEAVLEEAKKTSKKAIDTDKRVKKLDAKVDEYGPTLFSKNDAHQAKEEAAKIMAAKVSDDIKKNLLVNKEAKRRIDEIKLKSEETKNNKEFLKAEKAVKKAKATYEANPTEETQAAYVEAYDIYKAKGDELNSKYQEYSKAYNEQLDVFNSTISKHEELVKTDEDLNIYLEAYGRNNSLLWGQTFGKLVVTLGDMGVNALELEDKLKLPNLVKLGMSIVEDGFGYDLGANGDALEAGITHYMEEILPSMGLKTSTDKRIQMRAYLEQARNGLGKAPTFAEVDGLGDFGSYMADLAFNQAPNLAMMYYTGGASLYAMGAITAGGKFGEFEDEIDKYGTEYSLLQMYTAAAITGVTEALSEKITLGQIGRFKTALASNPSLRLGISDYLTKQLLSASGITNTLSQGAQEAVSEMAASLSENAVDKYMMGKDIDMLRGVSEAGWSGFWMSTMMFKAPIVAKDLYKAIEGKDANQKIGEKQTRLKELGVLLNNPDLAPGLKDKYVAEHQKVLKDINSIQQDEISKLDEMSNAEKKTILDIARQKYDLRKQQDEIANSNLDAATKAAEIDNIKNEISKLDSKKNKIIAPYYLQDTVDEITIQANAIGDATGKTSKVTQMNAEEISESLLFREAEIRAEIEANKAFLGTNQNDIAKENIASYEAQLIELSQADNQFGYIIPQEDGGFEVIINKDKPMMGTAAHELMHAVLFKSIQQDPSTQDVMGDALIDHVATLGGNSSVIGRRMQAYGKWSKDKDGKDIFNRDSNFGEEAITVISEGIYDGTLDYNEGFFNKIGDVVRRTLQNKLGRKVKFNTGRDIYNFIKDFNKSVKDRKISKAIIRVAAKGAKGKLVEGKEKVKKTKPEATTQFSKEASDKVQSIYEEQGEAGAFEIIEQFKPIVSRITEKRREAPNYDKELLMSEIEIGERGILDLISKYDPDSGVPLAAYINTYLPARAIEASRRVLGEEFTEDVTERVDIAAEEVEVEVTAKPKKKKTILSDRLGVKNKVDKAIEEKLPELDVENLNFKTLKDQTPGITGEMFGISPKKLISGANITKKELQSAQMFISKNSDVLLAMLPEGATTGGTATGVPNTLLKPFYTKTGRAKMEKTGTKAGLAVQVKNDNISKNDFLEVFGIVDGVPNRTDRNTSARVLALANQTGKMMTNQAVREQLLEQGKPLQAIQHIGDGKSAVMFSKSLRDISIDQQVIFWDGLSEVAAKTNPSLKNYLDKKNIKDILKEVYVDQIKDSDLGKIAGDIVGYLKLYQPTISRNKTEDQTQWTEFVANSFAEEANNIIKMLNLEIDGVPVKFAGDLYDNINNVQQGRRVFVEASNMLLKKYGPEKAARMVALLKGMYANNAKVGRGMFKTDLTNTKNPKVVPVKLKKGEVFGRGRNQLFESVPAFNAYVDQIQGKDDKETKLFKEAYKNQKPLYAQTSAAAIKDKDYSGRLKEAQEARQLIDDVMNMLDNDLDIAMFMVSNLSSMKTPLRRAANLEYISDSVLEMDPKNLGKLAEYEHIIPANQMALRIIDAYKNKGGIKNLNDFYKNYNVAIIPKTMDDVLKLQGLQSKMLAGHNFDTDPSFNRYYNFLTNGFDNIVSIRNINTNEVIGPRVKFSKSINKTKTLNNAINFSRSTNNPTKGITVLDFDDTLATSKSSVLWTAPDGTTGKLTAEEFAKQGADLLAQGYVYDFSEFNKVVKGKKAPLFEKALKLQSKFGPENMFILTARPAESAASIFEFVKANGLNIPLKNITGLANSTAEAKALWMADKVAEGYNDFYFADDALQNVKAVDNMLEQFDVKRKVQQARIKFSKDMSEGFNDILENVTGIESEKRFSDIKARKRGAEKGKFRVFIPPSHEDFVGLLYNFMGKGKDGNNHRDFFEQALVRPLNRAYKEIDTAKQAVANDFKELNKQFSDVKNKLIKNTPDGDFTFQDAIRVYLWNKHGYKIPGLSTTDQQNLVELVSQDAELKAYAETLNVISKQDKYVDPGPNWNTGNIRIDLVDATGRVGRKAYFAEFNENAEALFSEENLNKIEAAYGSDFRSALEDMLHRIGTGVNRPKGASAKPNMFMNWLNASVAGVMFFNTRSALLQQMSNVNYLNFADNNIYAAGKAFANQKQYWKDFAMIFNSDMMKQRRGGLGTDINGAELAEAIKKARPGNIFDQVAIITGKALKLGFLPTQIGDNIAIATGGAAFYRNRVNKYIKDGMSIKDAETAAFTDFQNITQSTQQSARPDMTSQQQASWIGKLVLNFLNTPSQYNRIIKKAGSDIKNRRITPPNTSQTQSDMSNTSRILYYGAAQNLIFYSLQTALFAVMFGSDDEDDDKRAEQFLKKKERVINGTIDTILRGSGIYGVAISTLKNMTIKFMEQREKGYNKDESAVLMEGLNFSPVLGIKARRIVNAEKTLNYNKKVIAEMETLDIDNPVWSAVTNIIQATTGAPLNKMYQKTINLRNAMDAKYTAFQRALFLSGYTTWSLNLGDTEKMKQIKQDVKDKTKAASKEKSKIKREEKKKEKEEENKSVIEENKKKSKKDGICSAVSKSGKRCKTKVVDGKLFCTVHESTTKRSDGKEVQCRKRKKDGKRCGMKTTNKSGYCYYHD